MDYGNPAARSGKMFGMYAETLARESEQFSLDLRLHLTRAEAPEARWACFARDGESPTEAERRIYRYRGGNKGLHVLLSRTQAGPGRTVKQEQEEFFATTYKPLFASLDNNKNQAT